jgi:hypothetical protein
LLFKVFLTLWRPLLITAWGRVAPCCKVNERLVRFKIMNDLIFIGVVAGFFLMAALYVRFCEKL